MKPIYSLVVALVAMTWAGCSKKTAEPATVPPTLGTVAISDITPTSARGSSSLKTVGAGAGSVSTISEFGLCYGPKDSPTTADSKVKTGSTADKPQDISATLTGLTAATTYYVRSYAIHQDGTVYGDQASFQTGSYKAPTVTTGDPLDVTRTDLSIIGDIKDLGTSDVTQYGHVLSENNQTPTVADVKTELGGANALKGYKSTYNSLKPNTTYYVRAYATNATGGTGYGAVKTVKTTNAQPPTVTTGNITGVSYFGANAGMTLVSVGTNTNIQAGVCWSKDTQNPTVNDSKTSAGANSPQFFALNMTNLIPGSTYYFRAFATSTDGTGYGDVKSFTTPSALPAVQTLATGSLSPYIKRVTASIDGKLLSFGASTVTVYGHCWSSTNNTPTTADSKAEKNSNPRLTSEYISDLLNLTANTTYYVRGYATNSYGTAYGDVLTFKTQP